jgi:hypothetical protein
MECGRWCQGLDELEEEEDEEEEEGGGGIQWDALMDEDESANGGPLFIS